MTSLATPVTSGTDVMVGRIEGPSPETDVANDMVRRSAVAAVAMVVVGGLGWGVTGAASALYGTALVAANFAVAAWLMRTTALIGLGVFMGAVLAGYAVRLAAIFAAVWIISDLSWYEPVPLGIALVVAHLGLLAWELRHVSATLAHPGLAPVARGTAQTRLQDHKEISS